MTLDGFFGSLHTRLREDAKVGEDSDDKWKENLACQNKYYRLLRDAAYALKHGNLTRGKSRVVRRSDQILAVPGAFSSQAFQAKAFQTDMVWIHAEDTNYRAHEVIKEVVGFARQVFSTAGATTGRGACNSSSANDKSQKRWISGASAAPIRIARQPSQPANPERLPEISSAPSGLGPRLGISHFGDCIKGDRAGA
jgi:hypothetical protein